MKLVSLIVITMSLWITGCSERLGPQTVLKKYVEHRFSSNQDLNYLKSLAGGELLDSLNSLSGDNLEAFLNTSNMKLKKFKIVSQTCSQDVCSLGYIVSYLEMNPQKTDEKSEVEVKKSARLVLKDEKWQLLEVSNVKTFLELSPSLDSR